MSLNNVPFYEESTVKSKLHFFLFDALVTHSERRVPTKVIVLSCPLWSPESMPPKRTSAFGHTMLVRRETPGCHASDWRLHLSRPGSHRRKPCVRCRRQPSIRVGSRLPLGKQAEAPQSVFAHWRSAEAWYRDDPSVPRRPLGQPGYISAARTSPRRDVAVVSLVFAKRSSGSSAGAVLHLLAWGSGVGSAGVHPTRNTQADGAPKVPGAGGPRLRRRLFLPSSCRFPGLLADDLRLPIHQSGPRWNLTAFQVTP